ncbi:MAG: helix-turn-helix domain-containing protein [Streptosporangiaceae bacterium]
MARRQRLVQRRKALGLTQEALAELLAVGRSTVVRWERGESEPLPSIRPRLARALNVSADLLEGLLATGDQRGDGVAPRQLPGAVADFTGRAAELQRLTQVLDAAEASHPGTAVISAVSGMAGVGKTALALYWAHQVAGRFPGGQLYVNLRGFDPSGSPVTAPEAIRGFLDALGVAPERVPASPEAQAALYRSLLADRRMLIVLDNARDEQQVRLLRPASAGTLVLVTSRSQLTGLAATDGARLLSLDVLAHSEATELLATRIGLARAAAEPGAVSAIASLSGCLPLAVAIAAARAATRPRLPLAALADELLNAAGRLDALDAGDPAADVRAVFSWSVRQLSPSAARMFRLLGIHPGPDISGPAAASLASTDLAAADLGRARRDLGELARAHLITERAGGQPGVRRAPSGQPRRSRRLLPARAQPAPGSRRPLHRSGRPHPPRRDPPGGRQSRPGPGGLGAGPGHLRGPAQPRRRRQGPGHARELRRPGTTPIPLRIGAGLRLPASKRFRPGMTRPQMSH